MYTGDLFDAMPPTPRPTIDPDVHAKIQKILNLAARAGTEAEAHTALELAHAMLAKYQLSLEDVAATEAPPEPVVTDDNTPLAQRTAPWELWCYSGITRLNFCTGYLWTTRGQKRYCLVGRPVNIATTKAVVTHLITTGKALAKAGSREAAQVCAEDGIVLNQRPWQGSFLVGFGTRIYERAMALQSQAQQNALPDADTGTALVLAPLYQREEAENLAHLRATGIHLGRQKSSRTTVRSSSGYQAGKAAGNRASLSPTQANALSR